MRHNFSYLIGGLVDFSFKTSGVVVFRPLASQQNVRDAGDRAMDKCGAQTIPFCDQPGIFMSYKPGAEVMSNEQLAAADDQAI